MAVEDLTEFEVGYLIGLLTQTANTTDRPVIHMQIFDKLMNSNPNVVSSHRRKDGTVVRAHKRKTASRRRV